VGTSVAFPSSEPTSAAAAAAAAAAVPFRADREVPHAVAPVGAQSRWDRAAQLRHGKNNNREYFRKYGRKYALSRVRCLRYYLHRCIHPKSTV
jgi:hypothetical protein